jgi:hypothetical protein
MEITNFVATNVVLVVMVVVMVRGASTHFFG